MLCVNVLFCFSDNGLGVRNAGHDFPRGERATQACVINALEYNAKCERGTIMRDRGDGAGRYHRLTDETKDQLAFRNPASPIPEIGGIGEGGLSDAFSAEFKILSMSDF